MGGSVSSAWFQRLRERGVIRVAASYAVIAWLLLQIAGVVFEPLGVPRWVMVALIVAAVIGFPVAVTLAWFLELGDRGISVDSAAQGVARPVVHGIRRYADVAIIAILVITVSVLVTRQTRLGSSEDRDLAVAVMPFQNLSTAADGEILAQGIAESVLHQPRGCVDRRSTGQEGPRRPRSRDCALAGAGQGAQAPRILVSVSRLCCARHVRRSR